jgi:hypothetical protein
LGRERGADRCHPLLILLWSQVVRIGIRPDGDPTSRVAIVAWLDVAVEMGNRIAQQFEVHLDRREDLFERPADAHHILKKQELLGVREFIRLSYMVLADQHAMAGERLMAKSATT